MRKILLLLLMAALLPHFVFGVAIGVNRGNIHFTEVLRDGYAQEEIVVTTDSPEPIAGGVILDDSDMAKWLNFSAREFNFSRDSPYRLIISVQPPADTQIASYRVNMSIITGELSRTDGGLLGTTTRASLGVPVFLQMTGTERLSCQIGGVRVLDSERGQPLEVRMSVLNTGNVRVNPRVEIEVRDKLQSKILESPRGVFGVSVLPTVTMDHAVLFPIALSKDQYWVSVRVPECNYNGLFSFDVLDPGEIKDDGEFLMIDAPSWGNVGDILSIKAIFRNNGIRTLRSTFKGTITRMDDESIVKVIDSEVYLVDSGVTANMETFFNPTAPGQYVVSGKVFYNDKLTEERNAIININGAYAGLDWTLRPRTLVILGILALIVIFLILIIKRKRQKPREPTFQRILPNRVQQHPGHHQGR